MSIPYKPSRSTSRPAARVVTSSNVVTTRTIPAPVSVPISIPVPIPVIPVAEAPRCTHGQPLTRVCLACTPQGEPTRAQTGVATHTEESYRSLELAKPSIPEIDPGTGAIWQFTGPYAWLSNFHATSIQYEGLHYPSVEHAYQAAKSLDAEYRRLVSRTEFASHAKRLGKIDRILCPSRLTNASKALNRPVELRADWFDVSLDVMGELLQIKYADARLAKLLIETGDRQLIEGNKYCDVFWGICFCASHQRTGENWLGALISAIRSNLC